MDGHPDWLKKFGRLHLRSQGNRLCNGLLAVITETYRLREHLRKCRGSHYGDTSSEDRDFLILAADSQQSRLVFNALVSVETSVLVCR